ncbi:MAG: DUF2125 domain-containing protein [Rhodobacteraceae bacterium]|nr:DUF2125 domain-containing protein [Paracoccaceae bacterium]
MTYFARLCCTTALALTLIPRVGMAGVTADDVWRNQKDLMATLGGDFVASVRRSENTLTISDTSFAFGMPFGLGGVKITLPTRDLVENGDGTVAVIYPEPITIGVAVDITGKGLFSTNIEFETEGYETVASGEANDVTYTWSLDRMDMRIVDLESDFEGDSGQKMKDLKLTGDGSFYDMTGVARVKVGSMVEIQNSYTTGRQEIRIAGELASDRFNQVSGAKGANLNSTLVLPRNGMEILNLAAAVQDGLTFEATLVTKGQHTSQINESGGVVTGDQTTRTKEQSFNYGLDRAGLRLKGTVVDAEVDMKSSKELPFPLQFSVDEVSANVVLPLFESTGLQDFTFAVFLEGLEAADDLWALFDPQEKLPRESANVTADFTGKVLNKVNWLDFMTVRAIFDKGEVPIEIHEVTLGGLLLEVAGAKLSGTGLARFDNSELESRGGMPTPSGVVDLVLSGGNGLLDNLVAMGLLSDQDATGARMAVAVFSRPDPDAGKDVLKSRLEMTEEGHILANGQRIQ